MAEAREGKRWTRRLLVTWPGRLLVGLAVLLVAARIALPFVLEKVIDDKLAKMDGYRGSVEDVDVNLYRGAFRVERLRIDKTGGRVPIPFLRVQQLDVSILWSALLDGAFVGEIDVLGPQMNFVKGPTERQSQTGKDVEYQEILEDMALVRIDRLAIRDGSIHFRDFHADPEVDIYIGNIWATATNLTNRAKISAKHPAHLIVSATAMQSGKLRARARIDPLAEEPTFDGDLELEGLDLRELNDYLDAYAHFDVEDGTVAVYSEMRASDGQIRGYVKPIIEDLEVIEWREEEDHEGFLRRLWEGIVGAGIELLENQRRDRTATVIPIRGSTEDPDTKPWKIVGNVLRNAFVRAFAHGLEGALG